jgi:heme-degrading monooxygenase HmoA
MISRVWHGWTTRANADAYENLLRDDVLPGIHRVKGFQGARVLRRSVKDRDKDEVEFIVITTFDSIEAVKEFAGEDYETAVIEPSARKLLARFDARSVHYEMVFRIE